MKRTIVLTGIGLMLGLLGVMIVVQNQWAEWAGIVWFTGLMVMIAGLGVWTFPTPPKQ